MKLPDDQLWVCGSLDRGTLYSLYSLQTPARTQGGPIEFINHIILVSFGDLIITTTLYTILATIN